jgi:Ca2+-binding RTX toxin-like protein
LAPGPHRGDACAVARRARRDGADQLHGSPGNDVLKGNAGRDSIIIAGFGADLVHARDGEPDWIDCGPGRDRAVVDRGDRVRGCEHVVRPAPRR